MRQTLTAEVEKKAQEQITSVSRDASGKVRKAHEARRLAEVKAAEYGDKINAFDAEDRNIVRTLLNDVNRSVKIHRRWVNAFIGLVILGIGALPLLTEAVSGALKLVALIAAGAIGALLAWFQLLDRPTGLHRLTNNFARRKLRRTASQRGISSKLERYRIRYKDDQFEFDEG